MNYKQALIEISSVADSLLEATKSTVSQNNRLMLMGELLQWCSDRKIEPDSTSFKDAVNMNLRLLPFLLMDNGNKEQNDNIKIKVKKDKKENIAITTMNENLAGKTNHFDENSKNIVTKDYERTLLENGGAVPVKRRSKIISKNLEIIGDVKEPIVNIVSENISIIHGDKKTSKAKDAKIDNATHVKTGSIPNEAIVVATTKIKKNNVKQSENNKEQQSLELSLPVEDVKKHPSPVVNTNKIVKKVSAGKKIKKEKTKERLAYNYMISQTGRCTEVAGIFVGKDALERAFELAKTNDELFVFVGKSALKVIEGKEGIDELEIKGVSYFVHHERPVNKFISYQNLLFDHADKCERYIPKVKKERVAMESGTDVSA